MAQSDATALASFKQLPTEAAHEAVRAEMAALGEVGLLQINIEVVAAVMTVTGSLPEIRALRADIVRELPSFDVGRFDKLETYALALAHAHALYRNANEPTGGMSAQAGELTLLRDRLFMAARTLAEFGVIGGEALKEFKTQISYRSLIADALALVALFKQHWSQVEGRSPVTVEMLDRTGTLALDLMAAIALKEQGPDLVSHAALARQQAFHLFITTYDDVRRAVAYLRAREGDAEKIAPSLYLGRGGRGKPEAAPSGAVKAPDPSAVKSAEVAEDSAPNIVIDNQAGLPITAPFTN